MLLVKYRKYNASVRLVYGGGLTRSLEIDARRGNQLWATHDRSDRYSKTSVNAAPNKDLEYLLSLRIVKY